jgi:hypothetical protein
MLGQQSISAKARRRRTEGNASPELQVSRLGDDQEDGEVEANGQAGPSKKNVDDLLPIGVSVSEWLCSNCELTTSAYPHHLHLGSSSRRLQGKNGLT